VRTRVGYCGGTTKNPTYHNLSDHTETVDIEFDPAQTTYQKLLDIFWDNHDPTACHKRQYMSAIFYNNEEQKKLAESSLSSIQKKTARPIATKILPNEAFYDAEDYHQKYMLRQQPSLLQSLGLDGKKLVKSHVAARLNGYVGQFGDLNEFEKEWPTLGITEEQADYMKQQMTSGSRGNC